MFNACSSSSNSAADADAKSCEISDIKLEAGWKQILLPEFSKPYMQQLREFLRTEKAKKKIIHPRGTEIFQALNSTPYNKVKLVILGQDPYHGPGQAHGLCFSVKPGVALPGSLLNIYKELQADLGIKPVKHGYLVSWAEQGVLLLNSILTVEHALPASHQGQGWEQFTDQVIAALNMRVDPVIFLLWGSYAQRKGQNIDKSRHLVLSAAHPSPLSAHRGFLGCRHFSLANEQLIAWSKPAINWQLPDKVEMR